MCGIAGFHIRESQSLDSIKENINNMLISLKHRSPDNSGYWIDNNQQTCFGHTRLSIVDLSENANQPMQSKCKRYIISFNGEIYNFRNLKNKYFNESYKLNTSSDTEILLELISLFELNKQF